MANQDKEPTGDLSRDNFILQRGERGIIIGQTGNGKSAFAVWLLRRLPNSPIVLYDTKEEPKFDALKNHRVVADLKTAEAALDDVSVDYVIFRSPATDPDILDSLLLYHYHNWRGVDLYIDELYSFHNNGKPGPGLVNLLTKGRSRGITCLMAAQRPVLFSRFALTETQKFYIFFLAHKDDRKRVGESIPDYEDLPQPEKYHFYFYISGGKPPRIMQPITLDPGLDRGYTDETLDPSDERPSSEVNIWV